MVMFISFHISLQAQVILGKNSWSQFVLPKWGHILHSSAFYSCHSAVLTGSSFNTVLSVLFHFAWCLYNIPWRDCDNTHFFCFQFFATLNIAAVHILEDQKQNLRCGRSRSPRDRRAESLCEPGGPRAAVQHLHKARDRLEKDQGPSGWLSLL